MNNKTKLRIIPLGGLQEIGKNITVYEYDDEIIVVDCGLAFPEDEMLGVDIVIADTTYLKNNAQKVKALFITHAHEDHIGGIPYLLRDLSVPIYSSRFSLGIIKSKLREDEAECFEIKAGEIVKFKHFGIEAIQVNHSTPDSFAFAIHTPLGAVIHTGDFKVDHTPVDGKRMQLSRFAELGDEGVLCLLSDSTNAIKPGYTMSERRVGDNFEDIFRNAKESRIIIASFASNVHRIQQVVNTAELHGRKIAFSGKGMINTTNVAANLGYLTIPESLMINIGDIDKYPDGEVVIMTTGTQGEPMSALTRIANGNHKQVEIRSGDLVILSSSAIVGNEKSIYRLINQLVQQGARVIFEALEEVHVSGHAKREELKLMLSLVRPKYFMPVHGEYLHLNAHKSLALDLGLPEENVFILENGMVLEFDKKHAKIGETVESGKVFIDGLGVGDVGTTLIRERKRLSEDGLFVIALGVDKDTGAVLTQPQISTRGFIFAKESEEIISELLVKIEEEINRYDPKDGKDVYLLRMQLRDSLQSYVYKKMRKDPMIVVLTVEVDGTDFAL